MTYRIPQRIAVASRWRGFSNLHRALCAVLASLQLVLPGLVAALPSDGNVVGGQATIQHVNPNQLDIQQTTDKAILNWKSFSIAADESVHFHQPSINSVALNRVVGADPSVILGHLQSNGRIFLLNPNGILFGAGAQIDVGGLLATTLQIRDEDFMAGRYLFAQDPLKGLKSVMNQGTLHVSDHGFVVLAAPGVSNEGMIVANLGKVVLGSGQALTVDLMGDGLINYALSGKVLDHVIGIDGKSLSSAVSNTGTIQADGGHVILQAKAAGDIFSSVVNQSGVIRAHSLENHGGVVQLLGGEETLVAATKAGAMRPAGDVSGVVINTGTIDISAAQAGAVPGSVQMVGERAGQFGSIMATGAEGANGGDVVIASTTRAVLASGSIIDISGIGHSSGGRLRAWSDHDTFFNVDATILARGGNWGGNGGFVELSGKENLGFAGTVNALAPFGSAGTLLLDPRNITIATAGGSAYNPGVNNLFGNTPAANVIITPASINAAAANVVLQANNDITVTNAIAMTNNGVGITMQAGRDILVNAGVSTTNGHISMTANDSSSILANRANGAAGDIIFGAAANLSSGTGNISLTIDPATAGNYAPGSITTVRNLTATTGNITLNSPNTVSLSGAVNAGSGIVSINANSDGAGAQGFTMNAGSSITATNAVAVTVNAAGGGTGATTLRDINTGPGFLTVTTNPGGNTVGGGITQVAGSTITAGGGAQITTGNGNISLRNVTTNGNLLVSSRNTVTLIGAVNAGTGIVSINANSDGAGAQNFTMNAGSSITTTDTSANAVQIVVNDTNSGTGAASLRGSINTGNGGTATVSTRGQAAVGGNTTGGAITQGAALAINTGAAGIVALATGATTSDITLNTVGNDFTGTVGVSRARNVTLRDANALDLGTVGISGNLAITAGGAVTDSGNLSSTAAASTLTMTTLNNAGAPITLDSIGNNFANINLSARNAANTANAAGAITYQDVNAVNVAQFRTASTAALTTGGVMTQTGAFTVTGTTTLTAGAGSNITLTNAGNNFTGAVSVISGNNVSLRDANALVLGASTVSSALALTTGGALSQSGALAVTGTTSFTVTAANTDILLGTQANNFGGALSFAGTLGNFRDVSIRNVNAGATVPALAGLTALRNLTLTYNNAPVALPAFTLTAGGSLNVTAGGAITDSGNLIVPGTTTLVAGANNITLDNANNFTGAVSVTSGNNVALTDINALVLGPSTVSGTLNVTTAGAVTQTGALAVTGTTTLAAGAANSITLNNAANNFSTVGITSGNNVVLTDANALNLAASTVSGTLGVTTAGALTQTSALTVIGVTTLASGAANDITLGGANNFSTVAITSGNNVTLNDINALILSASTVSGTLGVTTAGALTDSGNLVVTGTTTLAAGAGNNITLDNANNFSTVGITSGNNVSLTDTNALVLSASTVTGNLALTTGGTLSQTGALAVTGATSFTATTASTDILLDTQTNNFGGVLSFVGTQANFRDVQVRNVNAGATVPVLAGLTNLRNLILTFDNAPIALPNLTASGNLSATAGGTITQTGALTIAGITTLAAGANDITLINAANNFSTVGITSGNNVSLADNTALDLGAVTVTGNLSVTTGGALTQSGALTVAATTTLAAGGNDITLNNAGNNFNAVGVTSGNNVTLTDANALTLNASTVLGNFSANAGDLTVGGAIASTGGALNLAAANSLTQSANLSAAGANTINVTTAGGLITMASAATTTSGTGAINYTGGTSVTLGSLSTGGGVTVIANNGSVLSAVGSGTNVTAGANSSLEAFNGVVGTQAVPMTVNVNPGTLGVRATTAVAGISVFINGIVLPSNALTLLNVPPGLVCFNGCPVPPNPPGSVLGVIPSFNLDSVVPWYLHEPSDPPMISVFATYLPKSIVVETEVDVASNGHSVAREIPPCFPESACRPGASVLTAPANGEDPELLTAK